MICLYLLCNPNHYKSHNHTLFYWQSFVTHVRKAWHPELPTSTNLTNKDQPEKLIIFKQKNHVVGLSPVADYIFRSAELENVSLYDWVSRTEKIKKQAKTDSFIAQDPMSDADQPAHCSTAADKTSLLIFLPSHPFTLTYASRWLSPKKARVPTFIGPTLPRRDQGDHKFYCTTMLTLFKPWRSGSDLKNDAGTWNDAFDNYQFSPHHIQFMSNMNIHYECLDARDDFHAQMKKGLVTTSNWAQDETHTWQDMDQAIMDDSFDAHYEPNALEDMFIATNLGKVQNSQNSLMASIRMTLMDAEWTSHSSSLPSTHPQPHTIERELITPCPPSQ
jgi:hypothetical protein